MDLSYCTWQMCFLSFFAWVVSWYACKPITAIKTMINIYPMMVCIWHVCSFFVVWVMILAFVVASCFKYFFDYINRIGFEMVWRFLLLFSAASIMWLNRISLGVFVARIYVWRTLRGNAVFWQFDGGVSLSWQFGRVLHWLWLVLRKRSRRSHWRIWIRAFASSMGMAMISTSSMWLRHRCLTIWWCLDSKNMDTEMLRSYFSLWISRCRSKAYRHFNPNKAFINCNDQFGFTVDVGKYFSCRCPCQETKAQHRVCAVFVSDFNFDCEFAARIVGASDARTISHMVCKMTVESCLCRLEHCIVAFNARPCRLYVWLKNV